MSGRIFRPSKRALETHSSSGALRGRWSDYIAKFANHLHGFAVAGEFDDPAFVFKRADLLRAMSLELGDTELARDHANEPN